ncbi:hypothetical protein Fmac_025204 [Flemingia macrophylla]|uniref:Rx N-terminal domain-containing protein n=1 Tax=Flemingia macrophylla TaxID=520843 RepID=A0ABD1LRJ4_9FABA
MAEGFLFNIIGKLIGKLVSMVAENWRMRADLQRLIENMTEIKAVVLDAEEQQSTDDRLQAWLDRLKDALDDVDNLLDDFSTENKKRQVMTNDCIKEAKDINLTGKSNLRALSLRWNKHIVVADENEMGKDSLILEGLLSYNHLKYLDVLGFEGTTILSSINSFTSVVYMTLRECTRLQHLPPLHLLLHLTELSLSNLPCVEWIVINSDNDNSSTFFPSLKRIRLYRLHNLKGWCRCGEEKRPRDCCHGLNTLDYFAIESCPNINSLPLHSYIKSISLFKVKEKILQQAVNHSKVESLRFGGIYGLKSVSQVLQHLTELRDLSITHCEELDPCNDENGCYSMRWKQLANLRKLLFDSIPKMESVPEGLRYITTLESLIILYCPNLRHIPEWIASLQHYEIAGRSCPKLTS